jgi:23S rRNA (uridine2552-2'-O)-methyltransferase
MARTKSTSRWLHDHINDPYVKKAQQDGYRARAAYKLLELNETCRLIKPGACVLDLGSSPGSWSQIAARLVGHQGRVLATDILPMDPIAGVHFIQGDFTEESVLQALLADLAGQSVDLVISDMAPNLSGIDAVDQSASVYLVELALDLATRVLKPRGDFVAKVFQGEGFDDYVQTVRQHFDKVLIKKPAASRPRSREVYLVAKGFKP